MCQKGPLNNFNVYTKNNLKYSNNLQSEMNFHAEANYQTNEKFDLLSANEVSV